MSDTDHHTVDESVPDDRDQWTLTRRDAISSLTAAGVASVAGCSSFFGSGDEQNAATDEATDSPADETTDSDPQANENHEMETMRTLATVLYPSEIEVTEEFLQTYLYSRIVDEEAYATDLQEAVETLDTLASDQHGSVFRTLDTDQQVAVIENSEIRSGDSNPDGTAVERLNYHLVDELLFALYASPTGGELVGNPNPRGFPGGFGYQEPRQ